MKNHETWDDRYGLINAPGLHFGVVSTNVAFDAGVDSGRAVILVDGAVTVTLPLAADSKGKAFWVKKIDAGAATVLQAAAGDLIDGAATQNLNNQFDAMLVVSDGTTNWWILAHNP